MKSKMENIVLSKNSNFHKYMYIFLIANIFTKTRFGFGKFAL